MSVNVYSANNKRWSSRCLEVIPEVDVSMVIENDLCKEGRTRRRDTICDDGFSTHLLPKNLSSITTPNQTQIDLTLYKRCETQIHFDQVFNRLNGYQFGTFLNNHQTEERHRAKMLDWMSEVLSIYKQSQATFYKSVFLLDLYYKKKQTRIQLKELHLNGIVCMFIASKQEEVNPLKLDTIINNIGKGKFSKEQLLDKELDILLTIQFDTNVPTFNELFKCSFRFIKLNNRQAEEFFTKTCFLLGKICLMSYHILSHLSYSDIALSCLIISLKLVKKLGVVKQPDHLLESIFELFKDSSRNLTLQRVQICYQFVLNFDNIMPFVKNIESFCDFTKE